MVMKKPVSRKQWIIAFIIVISFTVAVELLLKFLKVN